MPTLPATSTGRPASRWTCPIHSAVVVLPLEPVTAMNSWSGSALQPTSSSPMTSSPRSRAATITGASCGTPGLLTTRLRAGQQGEPCVGRARVDPERRELGRLGGAGVARAHLDPGGVEPLRHREADCA